MIQSRGSSGYSWEKEQWAAGPPCDDGGRCVLKASEVPVADPFSYFCGTGQDYIYVTFSPVQCVYFTSNDCFKATNSH